MTTPSPEIRIDQWLSQNGFANSRTHAASLIEEGQVEIKMTSATAWVKVTKPSYKLPNDFSKDQIQVLTGPANRYVSRGGLKLEGALAHVGLSVKGLRVLDVGVSTGGFSDCCLQQGAEHVVGIEVGHGQLAPGMSKHSNFIQFEGINAKNLPAHQAEIAELQKSFDLIVGDVSFISITAILPHFLPLLKTEGRVLFLVKPQFELDASALNKNGIVKDPRSYEVVKTKVIESCQHSGLNVIDYFASNLAGKDGNKEFFVFASLRPI